MEFILALGLSTHLGFNNNYNEIHPHLRLSYNNFISGVYLNSEDSLSVYGGIRYEYKDFGLEGALVSGYKINYVVPMARATYDLTDHVVFFVSPAIEVYKEENNYGLVTGIEIKI